MENKGKFFWGLLRGNNLQLILAVIFLGTVISAMIPPFQSPDEFDHIKRAYWLTKGQFILDSTPGISSGGWVDSGLLQYMNLYGSLPNNAEMKVSHEVGFYAPNIKWSGVRVFSPAPGTGYYFPLAYTPQALGLMVGELLDLSVETSYRLARLMVLVSSVVLIAMAFAIFPVNPLAIALLVLPMSVFQFSSASLDAFTTALTFFAISIFLKMADRRGDDMPWFAYALGISVFILVSCRLQLIPFLVLPYLIYLFTKNKNHLYFAAIISIATLTWIISAIKLTHDYRYAANLPPFEAIKYCLTNPTYFIEAFANTIGSGEFLKLYMQQFIGMLGWMDTLFPDGFYYSMLGMLVVLAIYSASLNKTGWPRNSLLGIAGVSFLLIFLAILITANPTPSKDIHGVQGRYFLIPALLVSYALTGTIEALRGTKRKILLAMLALLAAATIWFLPDLLIHRYFV